MASFAFKDDEDPVKRARRRIERVMRHGRAMHIKEVVCQMRMNEHVLKAALDGLVDDGIVERLRPYRYESDDDDIFMLRSEGTSPARYRDVERDEESTTGGMEMKIRRMVAMAMGFIMAAGVACAEGDKIVVDGSTTVGPIAKAFAEYYMGKNPNVNVTVSESGSGNGAKSLINAACDVATMSRAMKNSEMASAKDAGILPIENTVAMDGIVMIVNPSCPIADLTIEQIRDIFTGKIRNWKELGGPDAPIVVISRDTNSGTYESFETLVMNKQKMAGSVEYVGSNGAIRQRVMSTAGAIGYVGLAFTEGVKAMTVNGVEASAETVNDKSYPISRALYMYTNGRPKAGSALADYIGLAQTAEGKKIVEDTGFVPLK